MRKTFSRFALVALTLAAAAPAIAHPDFGPGGGGHHAAFAALSPDGRATVKAAMRGVREDGTREKIEATRAQIMNLLDAEVLDLPALTRAMMTERNLSQGEQARRQAAMLAAYQKLSVADRHAFVAATRAMQARMAAWRAARHGAAEPAPQ